MLFTRNIYNSKNEQHNMLRNREDVQKEVDNLKEENTLCIVEGPKDKKALEELGITNIMELSKAPLYKIVEVAAATDDIVAILTDTDEKGKELYHVLFRDLQKHGVKVDNRLREKLFEQKISHVEGLSKFLS